MVNRLLSSQSQPYLSPFILPSLLNTVKNGSPTFSANELLILDLLQQLQRPIVQTMVGDIFVNDDGLQSSPSILSSLGESSGFDPLGDYEPEVLSPEQQAVLLEDYRSHLTKMFAPQPHPGYEASFYSSDLGSTTPLYTRGGLHALNLDSFSQ